MSLNPAQQINRRNFLKRSVLTTTALSCADFLGYFMAFGMPATSARAAQGTADKATAGADPHFLIYWFVEGGWMGYDMFNPIESPNNVVKRLDNPTEEHYRVLHWGEKGYDIEKQGNIRYGYLAAEGKPLFNDMAVLSSMATGEFHSGERLRAHMGNYDLRLQADREDDERSVTQAFSEVYGQPYVLPNLSWHWWLSDGELNEVQYTGRKGYYAALGPAHAHTIYAGTPANLRQFLLRMQTTSNDVVNRQVESFLETMDQNLRSDHDLEAVKSYDSARQIYQHLADGGRKLDKNKLAKLFQDAELREAFSVKPADELITYTSVNGNKARSKFAPAANVQAMMTYELMREGLSCCFWIETRNIRQFDSHQSRQSLWDSDRRTPRGQPDQTSMMNEQLWKPLSALVEKLKSTPCPQTGKSLYDHTTIVLTSEFGRTITGDVDAIEKMPIPEADKQKMIDEQDICQHWRVTSAAFMGGKVKGNVQYGGAGEQTLMPIPLMPDGSMDPAYDPQSGKVIDGRAPSKAASIPDHGDVYATALHLSDINPKGHGRNDRGPLTFIKKA